jgi:hypothetical protein
VSREPPGYNRSPYLETAIGLVSGIATPDSRADEDVRFSGDGSYHRNWRETCIVHPVPRDAVLLADLALRVPLGMTMHLIHVRPYTGVELASLADAPVDLVWRGNLIDANGHVNLEEHLLISGLEPLAHEDGSIPARWSFALPGEVAETLRGTGRLWIRASTSPVQDPAGIVLDESLISRIQRDSAQSASSLSAEAQERLRSDTRHIMVNTANYFHQTGPTEPGFDFVGDRELCDLYLLTTSDGAESKILLVSDRYVAQSPVPETDLNAHYLTISVAVTPNEAALIGFADSLGDIVAFPAYGTPSVEPYETNPNLEEKRAEIEALIPPPNPI